MGTRAARALRITGANRAMDSSMDALMFFWLNVSLAAVKTILERAGHAYRFDGRSGTAAVTEVR